eukprot:g1629.t1
MQSIRTKRKIEVIHISSSDEDDDDDKKDGFFASTSSYSSTTTKKMRLNPNSSQSTSSYSSTSTKKMRLNPNSSQSSRSSSLSSSKFYPWRILRSRGIPYTGNIETISFQELVQSPLVPNWVCLVSLVIDPVWLFKTWPTLETVKRIVVFTGYKNPLKGEDGNFPHLPSISEVHILEPSVLQFIHPRYQTKVSFKYGMHHSKAIFIGFPTGLRVIITSANLEMTDIEMNTDGVYCQDFPLKTSKCDKRSDFEDTLVDYIKSYLKHGGTAAEKKTWPGFGNKMNLAELLRKYDFSRAYGHLIPSVPGYHMNEEMHKYGQIRVAKILESEDLVFPSSLASESNIICQFSSFSSTPKRFLENLGKSFSAGACEDGTRLGTANLLFVWPTVPEVRDSVMGFDMGQSLHGKLSNIKALRPMLHQWCRDGGVSAFSRGRKTAMPHLKTYSRVSSDGKVCAWTLLTSANMSQSAWGALQKKASNAKMSKLPAFTQGYTQMCCQHWELGVLFTPFSLRKENITNLFSCSNAMIPQMLRPKGYVRGKRTKLFTTVAASDSEEDNCLITVHPLPFQLPLVPYPKDQSIEPWHSYS